MAGIDVAGVVEAVAPDVTRYKPGDEVFGFASGGSLAEFAVADEMKLAPIPANVSFSVAAAIPTAHLTSYQALLEHGVGVGVYTAVHNIDMNNREHAHLTTHTRYCTRYVIRCVIYVCMFHAECAQRRALPPGAEEGRPRAGHRR